MSRQKTALILLILTSILSFGQGVKKKLTTTFSEFDLAKHSDSTVWEIRTDRIQFLKNNGLDTLASKPYLDSICWFLTRHPYTVVEILLKKDDSFGNEYRHKLVAQKQTQELAEYLLKRGIDQQRLLANVITCGPLIITDEHPKKQKTKKTNRIMTRIRVLSEDFKDPNVK